MTEPDPLAGLRDQIRLATEAAERLVADARAARGTGGGARPAPDPATDGGGTKGGARRGPDPTTHGSARRGPDPTTHGSARRGPDPPTPPADGTGGGARPGPDPPTPPAGWQEARGDGAAGELAALARLLDALRALLPAELQAQVTDLIRQLLIVLRAVIDWAVNQLEPDGRTGEVEVWDIPID